MSKDTTVQTEPLATCRVCASEFVPVSGTYRIFDPALARCENCGTVQLGYVVSNPSELYAPFHQSSGVVHKLIDFLLSGFYFERRMTLKRAGVTFDRNADRKVLDVGCGSGAFLDSVKRFFQTKGIEPFSHNDELFQDVSDDIIFSPFEECGLPDQQFDLITFWHSLEHLEDPTASLREARRLLKDDGILFLSIPNLGSLQARVFRDRWFHLVVPRHTVHFEKESITSLLEKCGLETVFLGTFTVEYGLSGWVQSFLNSLFEKDLFYEWVKARGEFEASGAKGKTLKVAISLALALLFTPLFVLAELFAGATAQGAVLNVAAKRK